VEDLRTEILQKSPLGQLVVSYGDGTLSGTIESRVTSSYDRKKGKNLLQITSLKIPVPEPVSFKDKDATRTCSYRHEKCDKRFWIIAYCSSWRS
jgi:hypothetical protein